MQTTKRQTIYQIHTSLLLGVFHITAPNQMKSIYKYFSCAKLFFAYILKAIKQKYLISDVCKRKWYSRQNIYHGMHKSWQKLSGLDKLTVQTSFELSRLASQHTALLSKFFIRFISNETSL